ncbi:MAG: hypothetical protein MRY64_08250 [Hyphomonadaceae bacterium]|nr:hypothetical protein [Hyphomonadaceae bacterium]
MRLVSTLCELDFLEEDPTTGKYRASLGALRLGSVTLHNSILVQACVPELEHLSQSRPGLVGLWVRYDDSVFLVASRATGELSASRLFQGARYQADTLCAGRLAGGWLSGSGEAYACAIDTLVAKLHTVAVPVMGEDGLLAALSWSRLYRAGTDEETLLRAVPDLQKAAENISVQTRTLNDAW